MLARATRVDQMVTHTEASIPRKFAYHNFAVVEPNIGNNASGSMLGSERTSRVASVYDIHSCKT